MPVGKSCQDKIDTIYHYYSYFFLKGSWLFVQNLISLRLRDMFCFFFKCHAPCIVVYGLWFIASISVWRSFLYCFFFLAKLNLITQKIYKKKLESLHSDYFVCIWSKIIYNTSLEIDYIYIVYHLLLNVWYFISFWALIFGLMWYFFYFVCKYVYH